MSLSLHYIVNAFLKKIGLRLVNAKWGPRGVENTLRRIKAQGVLLDQIVDIGASNGSWTKECMEIFPNSKYFLVEPQPIHKKELEELEKDNPKASFWYGALGAETIILPLIIHGGQTSFLKSAEYSGESIEVPVRKLDDLVQEGRLNPPDFIKADIQGFELEALKGSQISLKTCTLLQLEVSYRQIYDNCPLAHEVIEYVGHHGFRLYDICSYSQRPFDLELAQSDLLFAKEKCQLFKYEGWA